MRWIGGYLGAMAIGAIMVAGLSGCTISTDSKTTTVTTTAPSSSTAGSPSAPSSSTTTSYTGTTSQGLPITFTATSDMVQSLNFGWRAKCTDGQVHTNTISLGSAPISDGSFSLGGTLNTGGVAHVEGKIDGDTASGELSRSRGSSFNTDCVATGISWEAHAGTG